MYRRLNVNRILETAEHLEQRIEHRFPESGLLRVASELTAIVRDGRDRLSRLGRPLWVIRIGSWAAIVILVSTLIGLALVALRLPAEVGSRADMLQAIQALLDEIVLVGIAVVFLLGLESRTKRSGALRALHQYRSVAHVIDMHQLTKDPERRLYPRSGRTPSSPKRPLSRFLLGRYLDYCSELLSLTSKMAALHVQDFRDPVVLRAARDVESLVGDLQAKIWHKKMILDLARAGSRSKTDSSALAPARDADLEARSESGSRGAPESFDSSTGIEVQVDAYARRGSEERGDARSFG